MPILPRGYRSFGRYHLCPLSVRLWRQSTLHLIIHAVLINEFLNNGTLNSNCENWYNGQVSKATGKIQTYGNNRCFVFCVYLNLWVLNFAVATEQFQFVYAVTIWPGPNPIVILLVTEIVQIWKWQITGSLIYDFLPYYGTFKFPRIVRKLVVFF